MGAGTTSRKEGETGATGLAARRPCAVEPGVEVERERVVRKERPFGGSRRRLAVLRRAVAEPKAAELGDQHVEQELQARKGGSDPASCR
jgi:hypothetical protein